MSFFNNQRNAGIALILCAVLFMVYAIIAIANQFIGDEETSYPAIVTAIGSLLGAFLYFGFGRNVMNGEINDKFDIICKFVQVFGFVQIINGIFTLWESLGSGIVDIVIGLIVLFIYKTITDGHKSLLDKIIWVILFIIFLITIIIGIITLFGIITIPLGIAYMIIGIYMLMSVLDNDVKSKFGM